MQLQWVMSAGDRPWAPCNGELVSVCNKKSIHPYWKAFNMPFLYYHAFFICMVVGLAGRPSLWDSGEVLEQDWEPLVLPLTLHLSLLVELEADNHFPVSSMLRRSSIIYTGKFLTLLLSD